MYTKLLRHVAKSRIFQRGIPPIASYSTKTSEPLRILFCGSDSFSESCLRSLYAERERDPVGIKSIDVLIRPGKPSGRSMKTIREVPVKMAAQDLGLVIHERDTFTGWNLPNPDGEAINLIIAVSFGLFVPPRILRSAEYGGINVHPSLLPQLRGPAPLQHAILKNVPVTGISVQTLDENDFDRGVILAQSPQLKTELHSIDGELVSYNNVLGWATRKAPELLVKTVRERLFVPPVKDAGWYTSKTLFHAPKITPLDRQVDWKYENATTIQRKHLALGRLWANVCTDTQTTKRFSFEDAEAVLLPSQIREFLARAKFNRNGHIIQAEDRGERKLKPYLIGNEMLWAEFGPNRVRFLIYESAHTRELLPQLYVIDGDSVIIATNAQTAIRVHHITVEGSKMQKAAQVMQQVPDHKLWQLFLNNKSGFSAEPKEAVHLTKILRIRNTFPEKGARKVLSDTPKESEREEKPEEVLNGKRTSDDKKELEKLQRSLRDGTDIPSHSKFLD